MRSVAFAGRGVAGGGGRGRPARAPRRAGVDRHARGRGPPAARRRARLGGLARSPAGAARCATAERRRSARDLAARERLERRGRAASTRRRRAPGEDRGARAARPPSAARRAARARRGRAPGRRSRRSRSSNASASARARAERARQRRARVEPRAARAGGATRTASAGLLGDTDDIRALVLHIAVTLLEAEKGMLLSAQGRTAAGSLEVICAEGFDNDPRDSAARASGSPSEVIEENQTVQEDDRRGSTRRLDTPPTARSRTSSRSRSTCRTSSPASIVCANRRAASRSSTTRCCWRSATTPARCSRTSGCAASLRAAYLATVKMLADAIQAKDPLLRGHSEEVVAVRRRRRRPDWAWSRAAARSWCSARCCTTSARSASASGSC